MPCRRPNWRPTCCKPARDARVSAPLFPAGPPFVISLAMPAEQAFLAWCNAPFTAFLESGGPAGPRSRTSYLAIDPFELLAGDPFDALAGALQRFGQPAAAAPVAFAGGAVGFIGYECGAALQDVPRHAGPPGIPAFSLALYDLVLAFDAASGRAWLISSGLPEMDPARRAARAATRARMVLDRLAKGRLHTPAPVQLAWREEASRATHQARVARAIAYIEAGDIYQANITAAFVAPRPLGTAAPDIYWALRAASPAPFSAFLHTGGHTAIASVSPERFLAVDAQGGIEARPIKGTRPRDADPARDAALLAELLASPKDAAENLMIVDLLRNDIARVASPGSVRVPELAGAESFASVHHLVSAVQGRLRPGATAASLLRAAFPGGSVTGAPKRRAQQIIHELEPAARGPYCGAMLWLGWDGAMDSAIAIRTATIGPDSVTLQAGGGIVADSQPAAEYDEMMDKAGPLLRALGRLA